MHVQMQLYTIKYGKDFCNYSGTYVVALMFAEHNMLCFKTNHRRIRS